MLEAVFGSSAAERVLLFMQNYDQGDGREIAATFDMAQSQVCKQLEKFESGGVLVSRLRDRRGRCGGVRSARHGRDHGNTVGWRGGPDLFGRLPVCGLPPP